MADCDPASATEAASSPATAKIFGGGCCRKSSIARHRAVAFSSAPLLALLQNADQYPRRGVLGLAALLQQPQVQRWCSFQRLIQHFCSRP
jgi:hypothetical protein